MPKIIRQNKLNTVRVAQLRIAHDATRAEIEALLQR